MGGKMNGDERRLMVLIVLTLLSLRFLSAAERVPNFTSDFPDYYYFSNSSGGELICAADGDPQPNVNWHLSDGSLVSSVPGLREISNNGKLKFPPFAAYNYRQDIHGVAYKCSAANHLGILMSKEVRVNGEVILLSMRCHVPEFLQRHVSVTSWILDSVLSITATQFDINSKYQLLPTGDLLIKDVDSSNTHSNYLCKVKNHLTNKIKSSVTSGRLIVTESQGKVSPKIFYYKSKIVVNEGQNVFLPCVANGQPVPVYNWSKQNNTGKLVNGERIKIISGFLLLESTEEFDSGIYTCTVTNEVNEDSISTELQVIVPLKISSSPTQVTVNTNDPVSFSCRISGSHSYSMSWLKDGQTVPSEVALQKFNNTIYIPKATTNTAGIYQCIARNEFNTSFASVVVILGDILPKIVEGFKEQTVEIGSKINLQCSASGNPAPHFSWTLDNIDLTNDPRIRIEEQTTEKNTRLSKMSISVAKVEDGGLYRCIAENKAGKSFHLSRVNIPGDLATRQNVKYFIIEDGYLQLDCPFIGYPINNVQWEKNGQVIPFHIRQGIRVNGSLIISSIERSTDSGFYDCIVTGNNNQIVEGEVEVAVLVPPKIIPFVFQDDLIREGARARIQCVVSEGESPIKISWLKNGKLLFDGDGLILHMVDEFSSILIICSITPRHNGNYTCVAKNIAGVATQSAILSVNVSPKIIPFSFQDDQFFKGMRAQIICAVSEGDLPISFTWLKDEQLIPPHIGINTQNYDGHANSLSIESVSSLHTGNYTCIATNQAASVSYTAQLLVQVAPKIIPFAFRTNQLSEGSLARISCVVHQGDLPLKLQWFKNGTPITRQDEMSIQAFDEYSSILTIHNVRKLHSGNYTCTATNAAATVSHTAQLLVNVPPKLVPFAFQDEHLLEGALVRVSCVVSRGDLPLSIKWFKDNQPLSNQLSITLRDFDDYSNVLTIDPVTTKHSGNYTCVVQNHAGMASYTAKLNVQVPPRWILEPNDEVIRSGQRILINCKADGYPKPTITWKKAQSVILVHQSTPITNDNHITLFSNGSLLIRNIQGKHTGLYVCVASNDVRKPLTKVINIKVQAAPEFTTSNKVITAKKGAEVKLLCQADGDQTISYNWSVNNLNIDAHAAQRYKIETVQEKESDKSSSMLVIPWVDRKDSSVFVCQAKNNIGQSEMTIKLIVQEKPEVPIMLPIKVTNQTIELNWKTPFDGHSNIIRYVIQFKREIDRWNTDVQSLITSGSKTHIKITDLKPATTYNFRVLAENSVGNSSFSDIITTKTEEAIPEGFPEKIEVESIDANTLRITWKAPKKSTWNGIIRGYNIGYKIAGTSEPFTFESLEVPEDYTEELIYQLTNLLMYTQYNIIVQVYNSKGSGPYSEPILAMTSEDVPSSAPKNVRCSALSSKSIYVLWDPLSSDDINGILKGYKVYYKLVNRWHDSSVQVNIAENPKTTLQSLNVNSNYSIQVLAFTRVGDGIKSDIIYCKTHEDVPDPPESIKVLPSSADSVLVVWKQPQHSNGALTRYNVYYKIIEDGQQIDELETQNTDVLQKDAVVYQTPIDNEYFEVKGLKKNKKYLFWVTATSSIGESAGSTLVAQTVADSIVAAKAASFDKVIVSPWNENVVLQCKAVGVPSPNKKWTFGTKQLRERDGLQLHSDGTIVISKVKSEDSGNYTCSVYNEFGHDQVNYFVVVKVPPSAPILDVISKTRTSIKLQWKSGVKESDNVAGYNIHYKHHNSQWETETIDSGYATYTLNNLACGADYQIYLEAFNSIGIGLPSATIKVTTEGATATPLSKEKLIREGSTFITLHLDAWNSNGCPVNHFVVEYRPLMKNTWTTVGTNIRPTQKKLVVSGLVPATWYILRFTAERDGGSVVTEYKFATHTATGGTIAPVSLEESTTPVYIFYLDPVIFIPAIALIIVVIIASVVVCIYFKRRTGSVGTPTEDIDYCTRTWDSRTTTMSKGQFPHSGLMSTLNRHKDLDASPYAMSQLTGFFPEREQLPQQMLSQGNPSHHFHQELFQRNPTELQPHSFAANETTFVFAQPENAR